MRVTGVIAAVAASNHDYLSQMAEHFRRLERMYALAPINQFFAPRLHIPEAGVAELRMMIRPDFHHAAGAAHGTVYFKALDDATFFATNSIVEDVFVLTVSFNLYLTRPVADGEVIARARVVSRSKRLYLAEGTLEDARGREVARGSGAFMPSTIALTTDIGYR